MNILHELHQLDFGGAERIVRNIIKFDTVNTHYVGTYKDGPFRAKLEEAGAKIVLLEDNELDIPADVIHVHSGGGASPVAEDCAGNFPIIETIHSPIRSPLRRDLITQRVGVSETVSKLNHDCVTILNGLDFPELCATLTPQTIRKELGISGPVVGRLGRLGFDKGLEDWLLMCYELQQRGFKFTPLIVGGEARNAKGYRGNLKVMAASLPVEGVVWVDNVTDIANYLQIMDVFAYPSPTEGFGLVFAEAIYQGALVAAYKTEVTLELFGGYAGLVDPDKGINAFADEVQKLLTDTSYADAFRGTAYDWVVDQYDAERMSKEYQELYERVNRHFNSTS